MTRNLNLITEGEWNGDTKMKTATFRPTKARYIKLKILSVLMDLPLPLNFAIGRRGEE